MTSALDKLTTKQRAFALFVTGACQGNATEAARMAKYKGNEATLAVVGHENLRKPKVAAAIEEIRLKDEKGPIADRKERKEFYSDVLRGDAEDQTTKMSDRIVAAKLLGQMSNDFEKRITVTIKRDPFEGRSETELAHYAEHGKFPG